MFQQQTIIASVSSLSEPELTYEHLAQRLQDLADQRLLTEAEFQSLTDLLDDRSRFDWLYEHSGRFIRYAEPTGGCALEYFAGAAAGVQTTPICSDPRSAVDAGRTETQSKDGGAACDD